MDSHQQSCLYLTRKADDFLQQLLIARGWHVTVAGSPADAIKSFKKRPYVGILDLSSGFAREHLGAVEHCLLQPDGGWVALVSADQMREPLYRRMVAKYCVDYLVTRVSGDDVADAIARAHRMVTLNHNPQPLTTDTMVGSSDAMEHLFRNIAKVSSTTAPVFISGESGTGKELTAAAIHQNSGRRNHPFVAINCGAIPHSLVQSELYGYERGAFTGAHERRAGKIESAHKGTLFLDEIGDLPMDSQASLLRFLQEGQIERLGSSNPINVDVRVISATHVDIDAAVRAGRFRSDLFHRLCVLRIDEPPLRARGRDIELLANHMLERFRDEGSRRISGFSSGAIEALYNYDWPGNVRELINRVRRAVVMAEGRVITADDLELTQWSTPRPVTLAEARDVAEQAAIQKALLRHRNRLNDAAQELGISRVTLYRLMGGQRAREPAATDDDLRPVA